LVLTVSSVVSLIRGSVSFGTLASLVGFLLTIAAATTLRRRNASPAPAAGI
jgi:uncharacterized membrane protein required for colicin V production